MNIIFKKVTKDNSNEILSLHVAKEQEGFIETTQQCLQEARQFSIWRPIGIYDEDKLIGFAMYGFFSNEGIQGRVWLDRFMIGHEYQGKGYGKLCLRLLVNQLYKEYNCDKIFLSTYENNIKAIRLYEKLGFKFNKELDINGEKIMVIESSDIQAVISELKLLK